MDSKLPLGEKQGTEVHWATQGCLAVAAHSARFAKS